MDIAKLTSAELIEKVESGEIPSEYHSFAEYVKAMET